jgi:hypothetical protein
VDVLACGQHQGVANGVAAWAGLHVLAVKGLQKGWGLGLGEGFG